MIQRVRHRHATKDGDSKFWPEQRKALKDAVVNPSVNYDDKGKDKETAKHLSDFAKPKEPKPMCSRLIKSSCASRQSTKPGGAHRPFRTTSPAATRAGARAVYPPAVSVSHRRRGTGECSAHRSRGAVQAAS
jgi:hypothetical protein